MITSVISAKLKCPNRDWSGKHLFLENFSNMEKRILASHEVIFFF